MDSRLISWYDSGPNVQMELSQFGGRGDVLNGMATVQRPLFGQAGGRAMEEQAAIDLLALTRVKGLGDEGLARLLQLLRNDGCEPRDLFQYPASRLREHFHLRAESAELLHKHISRFRGEAAEVFERARTLGIVLIVPGGPGYPSRLETFYGGAPPLLYALGNRDLLDVPSVAVVNSAQPTHDALGYTFALASRLAEAGQTLLTSPENPSYNLVGLGGKLAGAQVVVVLHHGLLDALTRHGTREPLPLARQVGEEIDFARTLMVSPFRLDGRWQKGNGPRRDALLVALAETLVAVEVRGAGTVQSLCQKAQEQARRVFVCQFATPPAAGVVNDALIGAGAAPLVPDSVGSNVDLLLAPTPAAPLVALSAASDLERRRVLGQFFTPAPVAAFMWAMIEALGARKLKPTARIIDPACGDGVFLRAAVERGGRDPATLFGVDIDETLVPLWRDDPLLKGAKMFRTNGLVDNPAIGLLEASFDVVLGNPPFAGQGLKPLLQLLEQPTAKPTAAQLDFFGAGDPPPARANGASALEPHRRAILDDLVRHLSRYACWRLRDTADDGLDPTGEPADGVRALFADLDLTPDRNLRAADYQTMAGLIAQCPLGRPLDVSQTALRNAVRRMAATAIEVYFVERFVRLARPGGMIAAIVPESILASDQLGLLRLRLMEWMRLLAVVVLPQKVFSGVGANARTGMIFCRRYTAAQQREVEAAQPIGQGCRHPKGMAKKKVLMISPQTDYPDWSLEEYLSNILDIAVKKKGLIADDEGKYDE
ncbi:MAG TPA: N-6 DNA methylase [Pirellulales bacterium]|nr:N-6 DNA methylase [Pirellulales bacterium]